MITIKKNIIFCFKVCDWFWFMEKEKGFARSFLHEYAKPLFFACNFSFLFCAWKLLLFPARKTRFYFSLKSSRYFLLWKMLSFLRLKNRLRKLTWFYLPKISRNLRVCFQNPIRPQFCVRKVSSYYRVQDRGTCGGQILQAFLQTLCVRLPS